MRLGCRRVSHDARVVESSRKRLAHNSDASGLPRTQSQTTRTQTTRTQNDTRHRDELDFQSSFRHRGTRIGHAFCRARTAGRRRADRRRICMAGDVERRRVRGGRPQAGGRRHPGVRCGHRFVVLAGGCFWGVQGVFQHVKGVTNAVSGYAGGEKDTAQYEMVGSGSTGHAESVQVTSTRAQISYGKLLQIYFSVAHDPTELNRQGPDHGTQYRSAIFPPDDEQARSRRPTSRSSTRPRYSASRSSRRSRPARRFYPGRGLSPGLPDAATRPIRTSSINDLPKIDDLKRVFPDAVSPTSRCWWRPSGDSASASQGNGAPDRTRTCYHRLRRPVLYPNELRARDRDR